MASGVFFSAIKAYFSMLWEAIKTGFEHGLVAAIIWIHTAHMIMLLNTASAWDCPISTEIISADRKNTSSVLLIRSISKAIKLNPLPLPLH